MPSYAQPTIGEWPITWLNSPFEFIVNVFSNLEAIKSATVNPAKFFGLENKEGRIKNGYQADLVILNSNPLDNIRNTQDICAVIKYGEFLSRESLDSLIYKN